MVGGGDSALEEALFLTRFADQVTVIHRRGELRASKVMQQRAFAHPKIEFAWNKVVTDVLGDTTVTGVRLCDTVSEEESVLEVNGLFVAIGHLPNTALFKGQLEMEENGYLRTFDGTRTNVDGVFACGDVQDHRLPPGRHRRRVGLHGGHRRRALARGPAVRRLRAVSPSRPSDGRHRCRRPGNAAASAMVDIACAPGGGHARVPHRSGQEEELDE